MTDIPEWLKSEMKSHECVFCNSKADIEGVAGLGIRNSSKHKGKTVFFYEYRCPKCSKIAILELNPMSVEEFVMKMIDEYSNEEVPDVSVDKKANKSKGSGISKEDISKFKKSFNKVKNWDEFLSSLGYTQDEIDENKKIGERERRDRLGGKDV